MRFAAISHAVHGVVVDSKIFQKGVLTSFSYSFSFFAGYPFKAIIYRTFLMVFLLILNIFDNPFPVSGAETNDPIASPPFERLGFDLMIDVMRTSTLQLADPVGN